MRDDFVMNNPESIKEEKKDLTYTQAQAEVAELEKELMQLKAAKEQVLQTKERLAEQTADSPKPKYKTNAEAYARSEKNIADMLAEYDDINNDDTNNRRAVSSQKKKNVAASRVNGSAHKKNVKKSSGATKKPTVAKSSSSKASVKKTSTQKHSKYEDAMFEDAPKRKTAKKVASTNVSNVKASKNTPKASYKASGKNTSGRHTEYSHKPRKKSKPTVGDRLTKWFKGLTGVDYMIGATGVLVLVAAIVTVSIYTSAKNADAQVAAFSPLGEELSGIGIAGESALIAMADNREDVLFLDEEDFEYEYTEYEEKEDDSTNGATVTMEMTSVVKDLKIKFVNKKNGKLIAGVPFEVEITGSDGKTINKTDEDKDGIIYINPMVHGEAKVKMVAISGYDSYVISTDAQKVNVKETPDYKKIDVANEVKSEKQVNAAVEDTAQANQVESVLQDTVQWVESTKTAVGSTTKYTKVSASDIEEPKAVAKAEWVNVLYYKLKEFTGDTWVNSVKAEEIQPEDTPTVTPTQEPTPTPEPTQEPTPTPEPTKEPTVAPTATPTVAPTPSPTLTPSPSPTVVVTPTVTPTPTKEASKYDTSAALKTKSGDRLYYKSEDNYKEATVGYYLEHKSETYYKQSSEATGYKYTGWQEIDGSTYFFDANGNKITGEQVIQGARYNFGSDGALQKGSGNLGIDVSKWNGNIDWNKVKSSGISYVIIRCGYRGSTSGALIEDPTFRTNIKGATNAGLKVGIYFFSQAVNEVEAIEEASMTLGLIGGYRISYPVFLDVEPSNGRGDKIDAATRTKVISAFCQTIRNSGYTPGVYANKTWLQQKFSPGSINGKIWLAQYAATPSYGGGYQMWQYTSKGKVSGISGNVDMNLSYLGY